VRVLEAAVTQVKPSSVVQAGDEAIETDEILLYADNNLMLKPLNPGR